MEAAAKRLCLNDEPRILGKALEYERLLKLKYSSCGNISDSTKSIICLDYAATSFNIPFDKSLGITLAGIQKSNYDKFRTLIGNLLNIKSDVNINSLCVQLGCTSVRDVAEDIYDKFEKKHPENRDWNSSHVACMAVFLACKAKKFKVPINNFLSYSHLKSAEWKKLKVLCDDLVPEPNKKSKKNAEKYADDFKENKTDRINKNDIVSSAMTETQDYESWRESVLMQARLEIMNDTKSNDISSADIINIDGGVRLIFN